MRILVATDAWRPQVNGVVNTYERLLEQAPKVGVDLKLVTPLEFPTLPCPTYPDIRLSLLTVRAIADRVEAMRPDYIHIATEGPVGLAARRYCQRIGRPFTTSYHTRFPEYLAARFPVPLSWGYSYQRWFHNAGCGMLVVTKSLAADLEKRGFKNTLPWSRGVNLTLFRPRDVRLFGKGLVFLYAGRVAVEKNIEAFLNLDLPGLKVVVGGGPQLNSLRGRYSQVHFAGPKYGEDLAACYASADVLVFPSLTDTFGNVMLEALASGTPVAAYPVTGPLDLISSSGTGVLDEDLGSAAQRALSISRDHCTSYASGFSWEACARQFVEGIVTSNARASAQMGDAARSWGARSWQQEY